MPFLFVATPIGNLGDLSFRALDTLQSADAIYCEDTRHSAKLLAHYHIRKPLIRYDDHATDQDRQRILYRLEKRETLVYISDAGTPMVSDPGFQLARTLRETGIDYDVIPGANAILPALQLSGLPCDRFAFGGFLPRTLSEIQRALEPWMQLDCTLLFYQSPKRIRRTLHVLQEHWPSAMVSVVKEITKVYQKAVMGLSEQLLPQFTDNEKGEFVLVISPGSSDRADTETGDLRDAFLELTRGGMKRKAAARFLAARSDWSTKKLYEKSLKWDTDV